VNRAKDNDGPSSTRLFAEGSVTSADRQRQAPIRVAFVGDDPRVRAILGRICDRIEEFRNCGFFSTPTAVLHKTPPLDADLALIDLELPGFCGIKCAREFLAARPGLRVIITSTLRDAGLVQRAFAAGISGYLVKPFTLAQCLATMRFVSCSLEAVRWPANPRIVPTSAPAQHPSEAYRPGSLTAREREILECFARGLLYKEVEDQLHLSHSILRKLQHRVFLKLGAHNRTEAINQWHQAQGTA